MPNRRAPTPENLIRPDGLPVLGIFARTVPHVNGRRTDLRTSLGAPASALARHFGYKQFQYFGILSERLLIGCALADTAWVGVAFVYVYDVNTRQLHEYSWRTPFARRLRMSDSPVEGESTFHDRNVHIRLGYRQREHGLEKSLAIDMPTLQLRAVLEEAPSFQPMSLCTRTGINGWTYANKVAGVPASGALHWQGQDYDLTSLGANAHHDFSAGYMRRETFWNWASLSAEIDSHRIGFNLSCGVNETSHTENCLWLDGRLIKLNTMRFDYNRDALLEPWYITSEDGSVELRFHPEGRYQEKMNVGVFATNFNQLFGRFEGELRLPGGQTLAVKEQYGFVEEQFARW